ncbi:unnamed protein product [Peronospora belbahrii]|uniref:Cyclin N-terminal domain-containing protein n=1 Tax=Peronospora belbahrii TaxID=622444 RepID=A0AAU9KUA4_9STRA|nr:unnamed protein product [Peronospora belbahrii]
MGDIRRIRPSTSNEKEHATIVSTSPKRQVDDTTVFSPSLTLITSSKDALSVSIETSKVDVSGSSDMGVLTSDSTALPLQSCHKNSYKTLTTCSSRFSDGKCRTNDETTPLGTPLPDVSPERPLLSDSQWEKEIAGFGSVLNDVLRCVTNRQLVAKTAAYMAAYPHHTLRFQIKMKQRAYAEEARGFQAKLMLFYVLHEFLKSFGGEQLQQVQREWFQTVDEIINACAREIRHGDKRNFQENRKRVFKTLARWEELKLYPRKIKAWKSLVMGECKPRRAPVPLPNSETERQAETSDQLQPFELPLPCVPQVHLDRSKCPLVFERPNFASKLEEKQHWRYTAIAFIDILSRCLGLSSDIALTACIFFHRVFDRGIYARERYKFAAACLFLSAKASSKRMKLLRMVHVMYSVLETPLVAGDEELLEIERLQLLYYEMEVLQGINFELTAEMPFFYLRRTLEKMPQKYRNSIKDEALKILEELFFLPMCVDISPQVLGEAAAYIAIWNTGKDFKFDWCSSSREGRAFTERTAKSALQSFRSLQRWKKSQQTEFDALVQTSSSLGGNEVANLKKTFEPQIGGLRLDPSVILNEAEFTKKIEEDSKDWVKMDKSNGDSDRLRVKNISRCYNRSESNLKKYRDEGEPRIKVESRFFANGQDEKHRHGHSDDRDDDRNQPRSRSQSRSGSGLRYKSGSWSNAKNACNDSRAHSGERRDRDRYDDDARDEYDDRDRYRDRKRREDRQDSRNRFFTYGKDDRGNDRHSRRDLDFRRDPSYLDRRDRKPDRDGDSSRRDRDSRSTSRSSSRSQSPRNFSRSGRKRKRNYSSRDQVGERRKQASMALFALAIGILNDPALSKSVVQHSTTTWALWSSNIVLHRQELKMVGLKEPLVDAEKDRAAAILDRQ